MISTTKRRVCAITSVHNKLFTMNTQRFTITTRRLKRNLYKAKLKKKIEFGMTNAFQILFRVLVSITQTVQLYTFRTTYLNLSTRCPSGWLVPSPSNQHV